MENPIKMDDLGGSPLFLVQHPCNNPGGHFYWEGGKGDLALYWTEVVVEPRKCKTDAHQNQ